MLIIILNCLTSLDRSKPIQMRIYVNHKGLGTPITAQSLYSSRKEDARTRNEVDGRITETPQREVTSRD